MAAVEVKVPDIGDFKDVEIIEVLVKAGDRIKAEQSLITVESDKASMEIPASTGGIVAEVKVKVGDKVSQGSLLLTLEPAGNETAATPASPSAPATTDAGSKADVVASAATVPMAAAAHAPTAAPAPAPTAAPAPASAPAAAPASAAAPAATIEVVVPDIGDFDAVTVIELLVKVGDTVALEQSLITVESDKASMEIPSSAAGVVRALKVQLGDKVAKGTPLALIEGTAVGAAPAPAALPSEDMAGAVKAAPSTPGAGAAPSSPAPADAASPVAPSKTVPTAALPAAEPAPPAGQLPHASPSIRKLARELGVPLVEVQGSGPKGRITQDDVQGFVKAVMGGDLQTRAQAARTPMAPATTAAGAGPFADLPPWPQIDFAKFGPVERKDLSRIRKISGPILHRNLLTIPHVTNHDDADITELEAFRVQTNKEHEKTGVKVTMLAFLIKACVATLQKHPDFNASLEGDHLILKRYFHIGFAADTPNGLMVPVIRDCDRKGVLQISAEMNELAKKARDGKLSPTEMSGGCFSISSLGGIGGRYFTPIINAPEVAILGVSRSTMQPVWDGSAFQPRLVLPMSLAWDHRVVDGAGAARFNATLGQILADFRRVLL